MAKKFQVEIVTPNRIFFDDEVEKFVVRTTTGDIAVLHEHTPLVTPVEIGRAKLIFGDENEQEATISPGILTVDDSKAILLTDAAEWPEEIDLDRAERAKKRAKERLEAQKKNEVDETRAQVSLGKAVNRIELAKRKK
ncbi:ATP synthase F1 subunit epsilon [Isachenkonia alkalipeptolytica]|uniref:ATP synthase epsilon chain n=1 Tax=Isachenkonia alkalipeptolytica TaxID=2565777 RepID=A0AA43XKH8_9CLOT|nr:ATP synthase F1 subunit epsilon [Isachenkonia alkalipeptolytica]NBG88327.1 ATP synthase F1 subunit epsilon [Isachenkonia alkalipeptolytica]